MNYTQTQTVITDSLATFGGAVLVIITAVIGVGLAYLVFRFGWMKIQNSLYMQEYEYRKNYFYERGEDYNVFDFIRNKQ